MEQLFNIDLNKISHSSKKEALDRKRNLQLFLKAGLPNKKDENWKFTDLDSIVKKNFKKITNNHDFIFDRKINFIEDFEHNYIVLVNGAYKSFDIKFEEKEKVKIEHFRSLDDINYHSKNNQY